MISDSLTRRSAIRGSTTLAAMFIPCLQYLAAVVTQQLTDRVQFDRREAVIAYQRKRFHPVLGAQSGADQHYSINRLLDGLIAQQEQMQ